MSNVIGGVVHNNSAEWLHEDIRLGTNLDFEIHLTECPNEDHDSCWENNGSETYLIGFAECEPDDSEAWYAEIGEHGSFGFKLDPEAEYSAICGEINTQVVASEWMAMCAMCSPCYPGQGDLDTHGGFPTCSLPPDMYGDNKPAVSIFNIERQRKLAAAWPMALKPDTYEDRLRAFWSTKAPSERNDK